MKASSTRLLAAAAIALLVALAALAAFPISTQAADQSPPRPNPPAPAWYGSCVYVVLDGDDFFRMAMRFGVSPYYLAASNQLYNPFLMYGGMVMRVPCLSAYPPPSYAPPVYPPSNYRPMPYNICDIHFVQRGEWLKLIAARFGVSWQLIAAVNRLRNPNLIFPGEHLLIPCRGAPIYPPYATPPSGYPTPPGGPTPTPVPGSLTVIMQNIMFHPASLMIHVGQSVIWHDMDSVQHSATQGTCSGNTCTPTMGGFDTGIFNGGQTSGAIRFNSAGTFHYYCRVHLAMMQGDVVVMP